MPPALPGMVTKTASDYERDRPLSLLTDGERVVLERLPRPPEVANLRVTQVVILEWLDLDDARTGHELFGWFERQRPGWAEYYRCESKEQLLDEIGRLGQRAAESGIRPILHLESHGNSEGLARGEEPSEEFLTWSELSAPLQRLNLATRGNLLLVVAACIGSAAIQIAAQGPRLPAVALAGPDARVDAGRLLVAFKEFYRRSLDVDARLMTMAVSASRESTPVNIVWEPLVLLAYEAVLERLLLSLRPEEVRRQEDRVHRLCTQAGAPTKEIGKRLAEWRDFAMRGDFQRTWNMLVIIDAEPENEVRFGLDMNALFEALQEVEL